MRALLIKDFHVLLKQLGILLIIMFVCFTIFSASIVAFALFYVAVLPITALAYDERSRWDELASMMPYSVGQLVGSKYLLGLVLVLGLSALSLLVRAFVFGAGPMALFHDMTAVIGEMVLSTLTIACLALLVMAVLLPFMFRFGAEKGRFAFIVMVLVFVVIYGQLESWLNVTYGITSPTVVLLLLVAVTAVVSLLSWRLSVHFYRLRRG